MSIKIIRIAKVQSYTSFYKSCILHISRAHIGRRKQNLNRAYSLQIILASEKKGGDDNTHAAAAYIYRRVSNIHNHQRQIADNTLSNWKKKEFSLSLSLSPSDGDSISCESCGRRSFCSRTPFFSPFSLHSLPLRVGMQQNSSIRLPLTHTHRRLKSSTALCYIPIYTLRSGVGSLKI